MEISQQDLETCLDVLQRVADSHGVYRRSERFNSLISKVYREGKRLDLQTERRRKEASDRSRLASTAMVMMQRDALSARDVLPALLMRNSVEDHSLINMNRSELSIAELINPQTCYICKNDFNTLHFFYHQLCPNCAEFNYKMRSVRADLSGRTALITGGRVKIGHQIVLRLLQDGAKVLVTTRFPHAAARRFSTEPDFDLWKNRVQLYGLDLRNIPAVETFSQHLIDTKTDLDIIIHNAAQTIRRPKGFYSDLVRQEQRPHETLTDEATKLVVTGAPSTLSITDTANLLPSVMAGFEQIESSYHGHPIGDILPIETLIDNEERADFRDTNSWLSRLDEVTAAEMLEVQLVNSVAPFLLNSRLKSLLMNSPFARRFIVNVSAMEGQFARNKTIYHPHTNMAKAALNMMTRTSGEDYARAGIYMNSVDTGWITDENPTPKRLRNQEERGFFAPLDIIDGMARIYHPVASGLNNTDEPYFGRFLKDYAPCPW